MKNCTICSGLQLNLRCIQCMVDTEGMLTQLKYAINGALGHGMLSEGCSHTVQGLGYISQQCCALEAKSRKTCTVKQYAMAIAQCLSQQLVMPTDDSIQHVHIAHEASG